MKAVHGTPPRSSVAPPPQLLVLGQHAGSSPVELHHTAVPARPPMRPAASCAGRAPRASCACWSGVKNNRTAAARPFTPLDRTPEHDHATRTPDATQPPRTRTTQVGRAGGLGGWARRVGSALPCGGVATAVWCFLSPLLGVRSTCKRGGRGGPRAQRARCTTRDTGQVGGVAWRWSGARAVRARRRRVLCASAFSVPA